MQQSVCAMLISRKTVRKWFTTPCDGEQMTPQNDSLNESELG